MKENRTVLEDRHPLVLIMFFFGVILISMFDNNIISGILSLIAGFLFMVIAFEKRAFIKRLLFSLILILIIALTNPFFVHNGKTILFFVNSQAYTFEALIYGLHIGIMLTAVFNWFEILSTCFDSDKWMYVSSRLAPGLGLMLSMVFRLIPMMKRKFNELKMSEAGMNLKKGPADTVIRYLKLYLGMAGWTMEHMPRVIASMKARGYGNKKRSSFSIFKFTFRDGIEIIMCFVVLVVVVCLRLFFVKEGYYYPVFYLQTDLSALFYYIILGVLFIIPAVLEGVDNIRWIYCRSKI